MAKAVVNPRKMREVVEQEETVVLTLYRDEASTLMEIFQHIAGSYTGSRGRADSMRIALQAAGVSRVGRDSVSETERVIHFID